MSLSTEQRHAAAEQLRANLRLAGATEAHLRADTDLDEHEFREAMHVSPRSRPEHVRLLRDRLDVLVHAAGKQPVSVAALAEDPRPSASDRSGQR